MAYPRQVSKAWYLKQHGYRLYMLSELSAIFLAAYTVLMVVLVARVHQGKGAFIDHVAILRSFPFLFFHIVALAFSLLHTATWLRAIPVALPLSRSDHRTRLFVVGGTYAALLTMTAGILALVLV